MGGQQKDPAVYAAGVGKELLLGLGIQSHPLNSLGTSPYIFSLLFDKRSGFVIITALMGFVFFNFGHVLCPSPSFLYDNLKKKKKRVVYYSEAQLMNDF